MKLEMNGDIVIQKHEQEILDKLLNLAVVGGVMTDRELSEEQVAFIANYREKRSE